MDNTSTTPKPQLQVLPRAFVDRSDQSRWSPIVSPLKREMERGTRQDSQGDVSQIPSQYSFRHGLPPHYPWPCCNQVGSSPDAWRMPVSWSCQVLPSPFLLSLCEVFSCAADGRELSGAAAQAQSPSATAKVDHDNPPIPNRMN